MEGRAIQRLLLTGGAGFIGSAVVRYVIEHTNTTLLNVDALTYAGNLESLKSVRTDPRYLFERANVCDVDAIRRLMLEFRPDAILHLAAESHVDRSIDDPAMFVKTNVVGTYSLLDAALLHWQSLPREASEHFIFHHVSTDEVYGSLPADGTFSETSTYEPSSPYSASKASSDHLVRAWNRTFGLPTVITNCSNNYGPYQFPEKLIPLMLINALSGKRLPVYGAGDNVRDWLFVDDHVRALWRVLTRALPGETYCIGASTERTNLQVVKALCAILDELLDDSPHRPHESLISFVKDRPGHDKRYAIDASKLRRDLGWQPLETFESGLRRTARWYLENRDWWQNILTGSYRGERLGTARTPEAQKTRYGA